MSLVDRLRLSGRGLTVRPGRTALSAVGIAIGITALVGVLGLAESSRADLRSQLDALGTNLLTVTPGQGFGGDEGTLPDESVAMITRIPTVTAASAVRAVDATVRRSDKVPETRTGGISVLAADLDLLGTVAASVREGRWLDAATQRYPAVVLGDTAARRLGIGPIDAGVDVSLGGRPFTVLGILGPVILAPELDEAALVGTAVAHTVVDDDLPPSAVYVRVEPDQVAATGEALGRTADPAAPDEVRVSRPSDALAAGDAAERSFTLLAVGLGAVALLVGGVGIANVMVVSVLERRREIGVRRALGASRSSIAGQFLVESVLLSLLGGTAGVVLGVAVTWGFAASQAWAVIVPWLPVAAGLVCSLLVGSVVGLYPALRAARVPPTEALRSV
ncbi:ABC transporter permease [Cellulomonas fengjieae]|uniref:ABC transporter permease n=1 Tax=Cellulomonas fengjieae TaxID=2819978 RepID=A0ABS3SEQ9_9CELL|nr:ABC transporter permease [Cellulomonas fengjieae]MBO3084238.1 ABC transporter permease [Cellulomonas fengjieae]MBO3103542.1 ABC transporter permease [Cellulomonas fengjieae]QVI64521.1 ABC transporter permease [Cellulomonas fengjieae]